MVVVELKMLANVDGGCEVGQYSREVGLATIYVHDWVWVDELLGQPTQAPLVNQCRVAACLSLLRGYTMIQNFPVTGSYLRFISQLPVIAIL
jgi:hypothetical protein